MIMMVMGKFMLVNALLALEPIADPTTQYRCLLTLEGARPSTGVSLLCVDVGYQTFH